MKDDDDDDDDQGMGAVRYPCMPSLVTLQQMRNRLHLAQLGKKLMKWTAQATLRELRVIAEDLNRAYDGFREDTRNAYILLARARFHDPPLNQMVLNNVEPTACVGVHYKHKSVAGVKMFLLEVIECSEEPYQHLGIEKGGRAITDAKIAWRELLKKMIAIVELRKSFVDMDIANKNATKRANIIKKIVIPRIKATIVYVNSELEEKEREDTFRLKQFKKIKDKKKKKQEDCICDDKETKPQKETEVLKPPPPDPKPDDPKPDDPKQEDPKPEDPKLEDPKPEDPKPEDPKPEDPKLDDPKPDDPQLLPKATLELLISHPPTPITMVPCCEQKTDYVISDIAPSLPLTCPMSSAVIPPCKKYATPQATPPCPYASSIPCMGPCMSKLESDSVHKFTTSDKLGYFEKAFKKIVKVTRIQNCDGTVTEEKKVITITTEKSNPIKSGATSCESKHSSYYSIDSDDTRPQSPHQTQSENFNHCKCMVEATVRTCMSAVGQKSGGNANDSQKTPVPKQTRLPPGATCGCRSNVESYLRTVSLPLVTNPPPQKSCPMPGASCGCWPNPDIPSIPVQSSCPLPGSTCGCGLKHYTSFSREESHKTSPASPTSLTCTCADTTIQICKACKINKNLPSFTCGETVLTSKRTCPLPGYTCCCSSNADAKPDTPFLREGTCKASTATPTSLTCTCANPTIEVCKVCKTNKILPSFTCGEAVPTSKPTCPLPGYTCCCSSKADAKSDTCFSREGSCKASTASPTSLSCTCADPTIQGCKVCKTNKIVPLYTCGETAPTSKHICPIPGYTCGCSSKAKSNLKTGSLPSVTKPSPQKGCPMTDAPCGCWSKPEYLLPSVSIPVQRSCPLPGSNCGCWPKHDTSFSRKGTYKTPVFSTSLTCTCADPTTKACKACKTNKVSCEEPLSTYPCTEVQRLCTEIFYSPSKTPKSQTPSISIFAPAIGKPEIKAKPSPAHTCDKTASQIDANSPPACTCTSPNTQMLSSQPPCTCLSSKTQVGTVCKASKTPLISVFAPGFCKTCKEEKSSLAHICCETVPQIGVDLPPTCPRSSSNTQASPSLPPSTCLSSKTQVGTVCKASKTPSISVFAPGICKTCKKAKSSSAHSCCKTVSQIGTDLPPAYTCLSSNVQAPSSLQPSTCLSSKTQVGTVSTASKTPLISVFTPGICKSCMKAKSSSAHSCCKTVSQIGTDLQPASTCSSSHAQAPSSLPPSSCLTSKTEVVTVCTAPKTPSISVFAPGVCKTCKKVKSSPALTCCKTVSQICADTSPACTCSISKTQVASVCKSSKVSLISVFAPGICKTCKKAKSSSAHSCGKTASKVGANSPPACKCSSTNTLAPSSLLPCACLSSKTQVGTVCKTSKTPLISVFAPGICKTCKKAKSSPALTCCRTVSQIGADTSPACTCSISKTQTLSSQPPGTCLSSKTQVGTVCKASKTPLISVFAPGVCKTCKKVKSSPALTCCKTVSQIGADTSPACTCSISKTQVASVCKSSKISLISVFAPGICKTCKKAKSSSAHSCRKTASKIGANSPPVCTCSSTNTLTPSSLLPCACLSSKTQVGTVCKASKTPLISVFAPGICKTCKKPKSSPTCTYGKTASKIGTDSPPVCTCSSSNTQTLSSQPPCTCLSSKTQVGTVCKASKTPLISVFAPGICKTCKETISSPELTHGKTASQIGSDLRPACTCSRSNTQVCDVCKRASSATFSRRSSIESYICTSSLNQILTFKKPDTPSVQTCAKATPSVCKVCKTPISLPSMQQLSGGVVFTCSSTKICNICKDGIISSAHTCDKSVYVPPIPPVNTPSKTIRLNSKTSSCSSRKGRRTPPKHSRSEKPLTPKPLCSCRNSNTDLSKEDINKVSPKHANRQFTKWIDALWRDVWTSTTPLVDSTPKKTDSVPKTNHTSSCGTDCAARMTPEMAKFYKAICSLLLLKVKNNENKSLPECQRKPSQSKKTCKSCGSKKSSSTFISLDGSCKQCQASIQSEEEISICENQGSSFISRETCTSAGKVMSTCGTCSTKSSNSNTKGKRNNDENKRFRNFNTPKKIPFCTIPKTLIKKPSCPVSAPKSKTSVKKHYCPVFAPKSNNSIESRICPGFASKSQESCSCESKRNACTSTKKYATFDFGSICSHISCSCSSRTLVRDASMSQSAPILYSTKLCSVRCCMSETCNNCYYSNCY